MNLQRKTQIGKITTGSHFVLRIIPVPVPGCPEPHSQLECGIQEEFGVGCPKHQLLISFLDKKLRIWHKNGNIPKKSLLHESLLRRPQMLPGGSFSICQRRNSLEIRGSSGGSRCSGHFPIAVSCSGWSNNCWSSPSSFPPLVHPGFSLNKNIFLTPSDFSLLFL